jgi:hypothetical protein
MSAAIFSSQFMSPVVSPSVARELIRHSLGSKPEQNIKSGMFSFSLLGNFANTASKWIRIPIGKK